jgi:hypothetical protein
MFNRRLFLSLILVAIPASADLLQVAISGTFDGTVATTELAAPDVSWVLTFDVDSQATVNGKGDAVAEPSNPTYVLNNIAVSGVQFDEVVLLFQDTADGGGVKVTIASSNYSAVVGFQFVGSPQLFSDVPNPNILTGAFDTAIGSDLDLLTQLFQQADTQTASIVITDLSPVPEPRANLLLGTVLAATAFLLRRRLRPAAPRNESQG